MWELKAGRRSEKKGPEEMGQVSGDTEPGERRILNIIKCGFCTVQCFKHRTTRGVACF